MHRYILQSNLHVVISNAGKVNACKTRNLINYNVTNKRVIFSYQLNIDATSSFKGPFGRCWNHQRGKHRE